MIGVKHFNQELLEDIINNPVQYGFSVFCSMVTATYVHTPSLNTITGNLVTTEVIKMFFSLSTAIIVVIVSFIIKKIIEPIWEQKIKHKVYKILRLK